MSNPKKITINAGAAQSKSLSIDPKKDRLMVIQERERLKGQLVKQFANKYAKDNKVNKVLVSKKVEEFVRSNETVTDENIKQLEQKIIEGINDRKNGVQRSSQKVQTQPAVGSYGAIDSKANDNNNSMDSDRPRSVYLQENGDEWAALAKYDTMKYRREQAQAKQKERDQKLSIKLELDKQIAHKKQVQKSEAEELKRYMAVVQDHMKQQEEREQKKVQDMQHKIMLEKASRDQQMLNEINKKKQEKKEERIREDALVKKLRQDMEEETKKAVSKRLTDKEHMKKVFVENEELKKKMLAEAKIQKELDVKAQLEYTRIVEKQMADRENEVREREEKTKKFMSMMADTVIKDHKAQQIEEERKLLKNYLAKEKKDEDEDRRRQAALNDKKREMKEYLAVQLKEKERKKQEEKLLEQKQADIWRKDAADFKVTEKTRVIMERDQNMKNAEYLKKQIGFSGEKQKKISNEEALLNKPLLKQIANEEAQLFKKHLVNNTRL